ncbi:MAG: glycosyltransferase [Opitutaceae bacterium]|nr:glycosyltransferase [Opitutaceae bacterium]
MNKVFFSVIIPTRNNAAMLSRCVEAISAAHLPKSLFEILIVDNSDPGKAFCVNASHAVRKFINIVRTEPRGLMAARHAGAMSAKGEILCFIDDDTLIKPDWLVALEERFCNRDLVLAGGPISPFYDDPPPAWVEMMWKTCPEGRYLNHLSLIDFGTAERFIEPEWIWGCNYCVRKSAYMDLRGTLPDYMPDQLMFLCGLGESGLSIKIRHSGGKALYTPALGVNHCMTRNRLSVDYFITREFIFGIEQSYAEIRGRAGWGPAHGVSSRSGRSLPERIAGALGRLAKSSMARVAIPSGDARDIIQAKMTRAFVCGKELHGQAADQFGLMMEWISRADYFEEREMVPTGAEIQTLKSVYQNNLERLLYSEKSH